MFVIDIDDVLVDFRGYFLPYMNKKYNKAYSQNCWTDYNLRKFYNIKTEELIDCLYSSNVIENVLPYSYSKHCLDILGKYGKVTLLTARGWHNNAYKETKNYLNKHDLNYDDLIVIGEECKGDYINGGWFIDDNYKHIESAKHKTNAYIKNMPWNTNIKTDVSRVDSLLEFTNIVENFYENL